MDSVFDYLVIGAGMAGASITAALAQHGRVAIVEREPQPGYHATGRSAALYSELYGNDLVRRLTRASRAALFEPPPGFAAVPVVKPRGTLYFASEGESELLDAFVASLPPDRRPRRIDGPEANRRLPLFRPDYLIGALDEEGSADIDVDVLLQAYLSQAARAGVTLFCDRNIRSIAKDAGEWVVNLASQRICAPILINAAGAWGDEVARLAGVTPVGLVPKRRTALLIDVPDALDAAGWPAAVHIAESFFFKPDAGALLLSPADETPALPTDAQPEELDIAIAVDRFETATGRRVRRVKSTWAGLRTFTKDKTPVVGFDVDAEGFFWFVGQGGYGIQMAPALARVGAALVRCTALDGDLQAEGLDADALGPGRLRASRGLDRGSVHD